MRTLVAPLGAGPSTLEVPWWAVAAGFAAAERWVVHLHFRRSTHSLSLGELPLVAGLMFLPASRAGLRRSCRLVAGARIRPRDPALQGGLQPGAVHARYLRRALHRRGAYDGARSARPDGLARRVRRRVSGHACGGRLRRGRGDHRRGQLEPHQRLDMLFTQLDRRAQQHLSRARDRGRGGCSPEGGLLLVPPTVLLMAAYRAYLSERRRNSELEFLYEATRTLSRSSEIVPELEALLARTARDLPRRRRRARPVLRGAEPLRALLAQP